MIVLFTVGLSIPLKKVPGSDLLLAMGADEVLWVPRLSHGGHNLPSDGLLAGPADPFGNRGDPQFVQVRLQAPQHTIQLAPRLRGAPRGRAAPRLPLGHELEIRKGGHQLVQLPGGRGG